MKKRFLLLAPFASVFLPSCTQTQIYQLPGDYRGGTATIKDSFTGMNGGIKAQIFTVDEIDGKRDIISPYKFVPGGGFATSVSSASRKVPAEEMILTLGGREVYGADGAALLDFTKKKSVSGDLYVQPIAGRVYEVRGQLSKSKSSVWLVDTTTNKRVGRTVTTR